MAFGPQPGNTQTVILQECVGRTNVMEYILQNEERRENEDTREHCFTQVCLLGLVVLYYTTFSVYIQFMNIQLYYRVLWKRLLRLLFRYNCITLS